MLPQLSRHLLVALPISVYFCPPEIGFQEVLPSWILPAMPEITVEENANPRTSKNDVGFAENGSIIKRE